MNINIGDLINQTSFTHYTPSLKVRFAAPKGRVVVMLLLGDADKKAPETFDATAALNNLGWIAETELEEAQSQLAALREELAKSNLAVDRLSGTVEKLYNIAQYNKDEGEFLQQYLADAERRNLTLEGLVRQFQGVAYGGFLDDDHLLRMQRDIDAALNPNPEAASHDDACAHSHANEFGCPECGEEFQRG